MLCEDRNCEWIDVLKSVVSSMNATANSATGISPHYVITGKHPNIGLPKLPYRNITNDDTGAYCMLINALLRRPPTRRPSKQWNRLQDEQTSESIKSCYRSETKSYSTHLIQPQSKYHIFLGQVIKTNDMVLQTASGHGEISWVRRTHVRRLVPWLDHLVYPNLLPPSQTLQAIPDSEPHFHLTIM